MATKEMVHNAVKYSKAKNIFVAATLNNGLLKFEVADNGIGFDTSASFSGNGMKNIRQRILELGGELQVQSAENKGTAFSQRPRHTKSCA